MPIKPKIEFARSQTYFSSHVTLHDFAICRSKFFDQTLLVFLHDRELIVQLQKSNTMLDSSRHTERRDMYLL